MTMNGGCTVAELANALADAFPKLDETKQRVALATYRRLAHGAPASLEEIARAAYVDLDEVGRILGDWKGVYTDCEGRVIAFWGLAIPRTKHRFEVDGVALHTWCAFDTLFLPELLDKTAQVESACATSGERVRLMVSPGGVQWVEPASAALSFLAPEASRIQENVVDNFCHYVHFFRSRRDGEAWVAKNPGTFLLNVEEGEGLAQRLNRHRFDAVPAPARGAHERS